MNYFCFFFHRHFWRVSSAILLCSSIVIGSFFAAPVFAAVAPNNIISYQGRLLNSNRVPLSSATASVVFEFYTAASGGSCVWSNSSSTCASATARTVTLTDGLFSENLGDTAASTPYAAIPDAVFGDNAALYLQVTVNSETLSPRKYISAAPYALNTQLLDGMNSDTDGSTSTAIVALNASGNLWVTGNPLGSAIGQGSLYINPASGDVSANDQLVGVAVSGTSKFTIDAEGDTTVGGVLTIGGAGISSSGSTIDLFDDATSASTIDIGGVTTSRSNTINIATNATDADTISLGNSAGGTTVSVVGGTAWSVNSAGTGTFTNVNCSDCITWSDIVDFDTLDASSTVILDSSNLVFNVSGTGNFSTTNTQGDVLTIGQTGSFSYRLNSTQNPSFTVTDEGSGSILFNLAGTGGFTLQDGGSSFLTVSGSGGYDFTLDGADNPSYTITDSGSANVITNLAG